MFSEYIYLHIGSAALTVLIQTIVKAVVSDTEGCLMIIVTVSTGISSVNLSLRHVMIVIQGAVSCVLETSADLQGGILILVVDVGIGGAELGRHPVSSPES